MKKNLYLVIFMIGILIIGIPQLNIYLNEINTMQQLQTYNQMVEVYPVQELTIYSEQLEEINETQIVTNQNNQAVGWGDEEEFHYNDPFIVDTAPTEYTITKQLFSNGVIGYITIPKIGEQLPIYNGATNDHLALGAATVVGTSFPVGGENTHAVISAHRGYAGANYFRHIDLLNPGDKIQITILDKVLTYEVIGNEVVEPDDSTSLGIEKDQDLLTLLTCHPFMVNNKRLLVHAKRLETDDKPPVVSNVTTVTETVTYESYNDSESAPEVYAGTVTQNEEIVKMENVLKKETNTTPAKIAKAIVNVTFKFNNEIISRSVKKDLIVNRLIILFCLIALGGALVLLISNLIKLGAK